MAERPPNADTGGDLSARPAEERPPGVPRWVKVSGVIVIALGLLVGGVMLSSGVEHGPGLHSPAGGAGDDTLPIGQEMQEPSGERVFYVTAFEPSGGTTVDRLAPPPVDPREEISEGYRYRGPGFDPARPDRWEVGAYAWSPASMVASQGDRVTLQIFTVNGNSHETNIFDPDGNMISFDTWITGAEGEQLDMRMGVTETDAQRGRETVVTFVADKPGAYVLHCHTHAPTMDAFIVVLPIDIPHPAMDGPVHEGHEGDDAPPVEHGPGLH